VGVGEHDAVGAVERRVERGVVQADLDAVVTDQRSDQVQGQPNPAGHVDALLGTASTDGLRLRIAEQQADPHPGVRFRDQGVHDVRVGVEPEEAGVHQQVHLLPRIGDEVRPEGRGHRSAVGVQRHELTGACLLDQLVVLGVGPQVGGVHVQ